jgi:hypothetical protein
VNGRIRLLYNFKPRQLSLVEMLADLVDQRYM